MLISTALEHARWRSKRRAVAFAGTILSGSSFLISSWSTQVWHLIVLQGLLAALGNTLLYTPTTLWLDEWFRDGNRATAYGVQFSIKNIVGTAGPFMTRLTNGKIGPCARDLVGECRRCGIEVICRNCSAKPPSAATHSKRRR